MVPRITFVMETPGIEDLSSTVLNRAKKAGAQAAIDWFIDKRLKTRFDGSMKRALKMRSRSLILKAIKENARSSEAKKQNPHLFTGQTRKLVLDDHDVKVTAKQFGLVVRGLNEGYGRRKKGKPDQKAELTRVADWELNAMIRIFKAAYQEELLNQAAKRRKKKRL